MQQMHATTILCVRRGNQVALGGDGQVSAGQTIMKGNAVKVRRLRQDRVLAGFAGGTAAQRRPQLAALHLTVRQCVKLRPNKTPNAPGLARS